MALCLVFCAAALPENVMAQNSELRRLTLRSDVLGWEAVGRLDMERGYCTGVLIANDLVLTAAHCLFDSRTGQPVDPRTVTFRAGLSDGTSVAQRTGRRAVVHSQYEFRSSDAARRIRHDVALVQLDAAITTTDADPFRVDRLSGATRTVSVVSYASGRSEALSRQGECRILGASDGLMAFDCDVTFGSSGAPVFQNRQGRMRIVSLISSGTEANEGQLSLGMQLPALVDDLMADLRSGRGVWPVEQGETRRITVGTDRQTGGARFVKP